jgi:ketosteroid isomerase-like protein
MKKGTKFMERLTDSATEQALKKFVEGWAEAELHGNTAYLSQILGVDYMGIGPRGFMLTREDWLQRYDSGDLKNEAFKFEETRIRLYGDAAVITGKQTQTTSYKGQSMPGEFRVTLVVVKQAGDWRLVNLQLSPILGRP